MSNLFATLSTSANTLAVFGRAVDVTQNNVSNASTPGYASQQIQLDSLSFNPDTGLSGGVGSSGVKSSRDAYADASVSREISSLGTADGQANVLATLQSNFDVTGASGISGSLNQFFNGFSALSVTPNSQTARQTAIQTAQQVVLGFQQTAGALASAAADVDKQIQSRVAAINNIAGKIRTYNIERQREGKPDANLDAKTQSALEDLSAFANVSSAQTPDGATTVLLDGQTPLVLGAQQFTLSAVPGKTTKIQDSAGNDITAQVTQGQLGGLLQLRNSAIPSQQGSLDSLAKGFADRVNGLLTSGNISDGPPAVPGVPLFTYDATSPAGIAQTLAVSSSITPAQIATIDPGPPASSNGIASRIAGLAQGNNALDQIAGLSFTAYYGQIASSIGAQVVDAKDRKDLYTQSVAQARSLRDQVSGVSLDAEAVRLLEYQKAYNASAKFITVINEITQSAIDILK